MKRCWFGAGLLLLLLVLGLLSGALMSRFWDALGRDAALAAETFAEDPAKARFLTEQAEKRWESRRFLTAVLSDHGPMNEADTLFLLLNSPENADTFRENALRLAQILFQLAKSQLPTGDNIL